MGLGDDNDDLFDDEDFFLPTAIKRETRSNNGAPKDPPKRRGRKPNPKPEPQPGQPPVEVKPKRSRAPETKPRNPYNTKRSRSMDALRQELHAGLQSLE